MMIIFDILQTIIDKSYYIYHIINTYLIMFNITNIKKINNNFTILYNGNIIYTDPRNYNIKTIEDHLSTKIIQYNNLLDFLKNNIEYRALKHELIIDDNISKNMGLIHQKYTSDRYKIIQKITEKEQQIIDQICSQL